jgi:hypothetical protein
VIASGPITQICWVTDDLEATERRLTDQFATGAWTRISEVTFGADSTTLRGEPVEFTAHISLGYAGSAAGAPYVELARVGTQMRDFYASVKARSQESSR